LGQKLARFLLWAVQAKEKPAMTDVARMGQPTINSSNRIERIDVEAKRLPEGQEGAFATLVDAINPLQHIPIIGEIYRSMTGDKISTGAQLANRVGVGAAVAGPIGAAAGAGVFLVEKGLGAVLKGIGSIFGLGKGGANAKVPEEVAITGGRQQSQQMAAQEAQAARQPARAARAQAAMPAMSSDQFAAMMASFNQPAATQQAPANRKAVETIQAPQMANGADFVLRMQANLDRFQAMRAQELAGQAR
jgi:hypothetical protein